MTFFRSERTLFAALTKSEKAKQKLDPNKEVFIGVDWKKYVTDPSEGYWEKGMTTVPLVAYMLNDTTMHQKVREHFVYSDDAE